jgi:hypothetical protein
LWRVVEAQHRVATLALVDNLAEQHLLEDLLEASKPALPPGCERLHYLLFTPFRYPSAQYGSRFRATTDPGIWYGAEDGPTACAELGYWRCRFVADSAGLKTLRGVAHTLFQAKLRGPARDLRRPPWRNAGDWMNPSDYSACQQQAKAARAEGIQLLRYASVRHPDHGGCAAVLTPLAFVPGSGVSRQQTWFLHATASTATWVRSAGSDEALEFHYEPMAHLSVQAPRSL